MATSVRELQLEQKEINSRTVRIFNPDTEDFTVTYDIEENGKPRTFTAPAQEISTFPGLIADHLIIHLSYRLLYKRGVKTNVEDDLKKIREEIVVNI
jgi:hypothetical protein